MGAAQSSAIGIEMSNLTGRSTLGVPESLVPDALRSQRSPRANVAAEESAEKRDFQNVLVEVKDTEAEANRWRRIRSLWVVPRGYTEKLEHEWWQWFHENTICKKLAARLAKQALALLCLTTCET